MPHSAGGWRKRSRQKQREREYTLKIADLLGVVAVFAIIGYVGYRSSRQVQSVKGFTLAGNRLGRIQVGFSMAATEFGGSSLIGAMAYCYAIGVAGAWWDWAAVPAMILLGIFFAGKIKLPQMVTVTEFFEWRYNRAMRTLATIMHLLATATQLSTQFMVGAVALEGVLGIPKMVGLLISVAIVLLYTMGGGLIAVANTDVVQFIIIVASLFVALPITLYYAGGISGLSELLPAEFLSFGNIPTSTVISWCLFCFFTYATNQHYIQQIFAAKDKTTARFAFLFTGGAYFVYGFLVAVLGICIAGLLPGLSDPNMGYALLIKTYMPVGVAGLVLGGIFAASMSTAAAMLLAASTLFVNDIYNPLLLHGKKDERAALRTIRIVTVVICSLSVSVSLLMSNIIDIMYLGGLFYSTAVFFPLVIGLFWKRATAPAALISMISAVVVGLVSEFFLAGQVPGLLGLPSNVMAASTSFILFVVISKLTPPPPEEKIAFLQTASRK